MAPGARAPAIPASETCSPPARCHLPTLDPLEDNWDDAHGFTPNHTLWSLSDWASKGQYRGVKGIEGTGISQTGDMLRPGSYIV